jgi:hypothetical protein
MEFWKENKLSGRFVYPVEAVAGLFMKHWHKEKLEHAPFPLERMLRNWLTAKDGFNSVWTAETGPESFETLYEIVRERTRA